MKKTLSIQSKIFIPILTLLILLTIISYFIFTYSVTHFLHKSGENDIKNVTETALPLADEIFTFSKYSYFYNNLIHYENSAVFFDETKPILSQTVFDTKIFLMDNDYNLIYPVKANLWENSKYVYDYYIQNNLSSQSQIDYIEFNLQNKNYILKTIESQNKNSYIKYFVCYSEIPNISNMMFRVSILVFVITLISSAIILPFIWLSTKGISKSIKKLCIQTENIGNNNFEIVNLKSNIIEINELNTSINEMSNKLKQYDTSQKMFFSNVSHEIRTPIMSIKGYAEGIKYNVFDDVNNAADIILSESDRLSLLINRLLLLSRIDNSKQKKELEKIDICEFLKEYIKNYNKKAINIKINFIPTKLIVNADEVLIKSIIDNLISNCTRYAKSEISVKISGNILYIGDDGKGFSKTDLEHLFERFYKGENGETGLGLSIVKSSLNYMNGEISAYNGKKGAVFKIEFKS